MWKMWSRRLLNAQDICWTGCVIFSDEVRGWLVWTMEE